MKSLAHKIFKVALRFCYLAPLMTWFMLGFFDQLGAEPIVKINSQSGYVTLVLILINLWIGILLSLHLRFLRKIKWLLMERRSLGIVAGFYAVFHFTSYLGKESFLPKAWEQIVTKTYLNYGILAALIIWSLAITSNQLAVRKMGMGRWKTLHRLVHLASLLIIGHVLSIEKGNIPLLLVLIGPLIPFQLFRLCRAFIKSK